MHCDQAEGQRHSGVTDGGSGGVSVDSSPGNSRPATSGSESILGAVPHRIDRNQGVSPESRKTKETSDVEWLPAVT